MEHNAKEVLVIPETPRTVSRQTFQVYLPEAGYNTPGVSRYDSKHFVVSDGKVKLRYDNSLKSVVDFTIDNSTGEVTILYNDGTKAKITLTSNLQNVVIRDVVSELSFESSDWIMDSEDYYIVIKNSTFGNLDKQIITVERKENDNYVVDLVEIVKNSQGNVLIRTLSPFTGRALILNNKINDIYVPLKNGEGLDSIEQHGANAFGDGSIALITGYAHGNYSFAALGEAYGRYSFAFGNGAIAGYTEEEFNAKFPQGIDDYGRPWSGTGTRYFYPEYRAFSVSFGRDVLSKGKAAFAAGYSSQAIGNNSFAISGGKTFADDSFAGAWSVVNGTRSFGFGAGNTISSDYSFGIGLNHTINAYNAMSLGNKNTVTGQSGLAIGYQNSSEGSYSFSGGSLSIARGTGSFAFGLGGTHALGYNSFAFGYQSVSNAVGAISLGSNIINSAQGNKIVLGNANVDLAGHILEVGNGTPTKRSNAFVVHLDGRASVQTAPQNDEDVVRLKELNGKLDKTKSSTYIIMQTNESHFLNTMGENCLIFITGLENGDNYIDFYNSKNAKIDNATYNLSKNDVIIISKVGTTLSMIKFHDGAHPETKYIEDVSSFTKTTGNALLSIM